MKMKVLICRHYRNFSLLDPNCIHSKCSPCSTSRASSRGCCTTILQKPPTEMIPPLPFYGQRMVLPTSCTCSQPSHYAFCVDQKPAAKTQPWWVLPLEGFVAEFSWALVSPGMLWTCLQDPDSHQSIFWDLPQVLNALLKTSGERISSELSWSTPGTSPRPMVHQGNLGTNWESRSHSWLLFKQGHTLTPPPPP